MLHAHRIQRKEFMGSNLLNEVVFMGGLVAIIISVLYVLFQAIVMR